MLKRWLDSDSFWKRTAAIWAHGLAARAALTLVTLIVWIAVNL